MLSFPGILDAVDRCTVVLGAVGAKGDARPGVVQGNPGLCARALVLLLLIWMLLIWSMHARWERICTIAMRYPLALTINAPGSRSMLGQKRRRWWALAILTVNAAAYFLAIYRWADIADQANVANIPYGYLLNIFALFPAISAVEVLICMWFWKRVGRLESCHEILRGTLLDGVILPPLCAVWLFAMYAESFIHAAIWMWVGAPVFASQAVVWLRFFLWSRRESL